MPYTKHVWHNDEYLTVSQLNEMSEALENVDQDLSDKQDVIDENNKLSVDYLSEGSTNKLLTLTEYNSVTTNLSNLNGSVNSINTTLGNKQNTLSSSNKLNADYVSTGSTNKILTKTDYNNLNTSINNLWGKCGELGEDVSEMSSKVDQIETIVNTEISRVVSDIREDLDYFEQSESNQNELLDEITAEVGLNKLETLEYPTETVQVRLSQKVETNTLLIDQILNELGLTDLNEEEYPTSETPRTIRQLINALSHSVADAELIVLDFTNSVEMTAELYAKLTNPNRKIRIIYDNGNTYSDIIRLVKQTNELDEITYTGSTIDEDISIVFNETTINLQDTRPTGN